MEKEKNIVILMETYYMKESLKMIKKMEMEKNILMETYYMTENSKMVKEMEMEKNMIGLLIN